MSQEISFEGTDEILIFDRVLTESEQKTLYKAHQLRKEARVEKGGE